MVALIDPVTLAGLREDGDDLLTDLIELFLRETPERLRLLVDGLAADDARQAERMAHTLKSTAATLGAEAMREIAFEAETAAHVDDLDKVRHLLPSLDKEVKNAQQALLAERSRLTG